MAGRKTRRGRSSSSTRKRASSPRTSWRRSTLRVSARPAEADVQTSDLGSFCCLSFHRCVQHHGYISVTHTQLHLSDTHSRKHTHISDQSPPGFFHQHLFHNKSNLSFPAWVCLVLHRELFDVINQALVSLNSLELSCCF